jgi:uncharacterized membrane protein YbhN (UPF0104 family)
LRSAERGDYLALTAWVGGIVAARVAAATAIAAACGIQHPVAAALLVVPALELAGIFPVTPANAGVAGGAAALAFHAGGVPLDAALRAGFVLHAVETGAGIVVGACGGARLLRRSPLRFRSVTTWPTTICRAAGTLRAR